MDFFNALTTVDMIKYGLLAIIAIALLGGLVWLRRTFTAKKKGHGGGGGDHGGSHEHPPDWNHRVSQLIFGAFLLLIGYAILVEVL